MLSLRSTANLMGSTSRVVSTRHLAKMVLLQPPISLLHLNELGCTWIKLNFVMQNQEQINWCWAAVTVSICKFFNPNCSWTQCSLVNAEFERSDCCVNGSSDDCNQPWRFFKALTRTGNLQSQTYNAASFENIMREINKKHPISAGINWSGGGGHNVAIIGFHFALRMVAIEDPLYGPSTLSYEVFKSAYLGFGTWNIKCYVKP